MKPSPRSAVLSCPRKEDQVIFPAASAVELVARLTTDTELLKQVTDRNPPASKDTDTGASLPCGARSRDER